ncbi:MAG: EamA family transporter [Candidatus Aenigmarchaeota archaeon]|nr:EamA family transporter [Candidatus Aenigmarchaeota archaeon]
MLFYLKALKKDEPDRVVALWYLSPIFIAIMSSFLINEIFGIKEYVGILLLVVGAVMISVNKLEGYFKLSEAFWLMIVTNVLTSFYIVVLKIMMFRITPYTALFLLNLSFFFISLLVFLLKRQKIQNEIKKLKKKGWLIKILGLLPYWSGAIAFYRAMKIGPVSLVNALNAFQPLFVFLFSLVLSLRFDYFKQKIDRITILQKIVSIGMLIIGSFLIS